MSNLLKAEFYKLLHHKGFWGMTLFSIVLGSILMLDSGLPESAGGAFRSSLYNTPLLYFLPIIFCALFAGEDFETRTLHCYISSGHTRGSILASKILSCLAACTVMLAAPLAVHGLAGMAVFGMDRNMSEGNMIWYGAVIFSAILAMGMLPLFCTFLCRDVGKSLAVPMVFFFLMIFLLNSDKAELFVLVFPMGQLRLLSLQDVPNSWPLMAAADFLWIAGCCTGAYAAFMRSDLK